MVKFKASGAGSGRVAVYTGADDDPFTDPLGNLSRVKFHSDLDYPAIVDTRTGTLTLPRRNQVANTLATYNLFSHGAGGFPLVFGRITNLSGTPVLAGSVPVQFNDWGFGRWLTLGANNTHVIMHEQVVGGQADPGVDNEGFNDANDFSGINIAWEVYVTDTLLE